MNKMHRLQLERIWKRSPIAHINNIACWDSTGTSREGARVNVELSYAAKTFRRKTLGGAGWPAWPKGNMPANHNWPLTPPDWYVARIKQDCPRNAKAILAAYGRTHTQYDACDGKWCKIHKGTNYRAPSLQGE
jgi:hypothetical protein